MFKQLLEKENSMFITDTDITTGFDIKSHKQNDNINKLYKFIGDKKFIISKPETDLKDRYSFRLELYIDTKKECEYYFDPVTHLLQDREFHPGDKWICFMAEYSGQNSVQYFVNCSKDSEQYGKILRASIVNLILDFEEAQEYMIDHVNSYIDIVCS